MTLVFKDVAMKSGIIAPPNATSLANTQSPRGEAAMKNNFCIR